MDKFEEKMIKLQKMLVKLSVAKELTGIAQDKQKQAIYKMTDGKNGVRDIAKKLKVSSVTISALWKEWQILGLVIQDGKKYYNIDEYLNTL